MFRLGPIYSDKSRKLVHIRRHAAHCADAGDYLCISVASFGCMPAGAGSKDTLQGFHHLVPQATFDCFSSSFASTNLKIPMIGWVTLFP
jgi:hypothetical protein